MHPSEDVLEEYSFARLGEDDTARVEEHLLLCESCRDSLEHVVGFIQAMKTAIPEHREEPVTRPLLGRRLFGQGWFEWPRAHPLGASVTAAAIALGCLIAVVSWRSSQPLTSAPIALASFRGSPDLSTALGPAGRPLDLIIDPVGIGDGTRYRVEVVTDSGRAVWNGSTNLQDGKLLAHVQRGLGAGNYWVRLYAPGNVLLREFGLRLE